MRPSRAIIAIRATAALLLAMPLGGCLNPSNTLIGAGPDPLPDLSRTPTDLADARVTGMPTGATTPAPSLTGLDRSNWPLVLIYQPRGQVETSFFGTSEPSGAVQRGPGPLGAPER